MTSFNFTFLLIELIWKHFFILKLNYEFLKFWKGKIYVCVGDVMSECGQPGMEIRGQLLGAGSSFSP